MGMRVGSGSLEAYLSAEKTRAAVGVEALHRLSPGASLYGRGEAGLLLGSDYDPFWAVSGGLRWVW